LLLRLGVLPTADNTLTEQHSPRIQRIEAVPLMRNEAAALR
jgi:hypothetical protein